MREATNRLQSEPSQAYQAWLLRDRRSNRSVLAIRIGFLVLLLALWEALARLHIVNPVLTSYPSAIWPTFVALLQSTPYQPSIIAHAGSTALATVIGFVLAGALGVVVSAALWWWPLAHRVLDPYLVVANALPKTAFVPIFYIWLGPIFSIYAMSLAISLFVTILMIHGGMQEVDPNKIKLARVLGADKWQVLTKIVLPASVPTMIGALKVNAGLSLVGVVVGELQSGNMGLGYLIQYGSQIFKLDIVMVAVVVLAVLSSLMYAAIAWLESAILKRR